MAIVKKAAKKAAKKTAKKAAKKGAARHGEAHHLRRAYEHINRVRTLHLGLQAEALGMVDALSRMAQASMMVEDAKSAAALLRVAEHVAFGYLTSAEADHSLSLPLLAATNDEFDDLMMRAEEQPPIARGELRTIYTTLMTEANHARMGEAYPRALEFARAAEGLTHVAPGAGQRKISGKAGEALRLR